MSKTKRNNKIVKVNTPVVDNIDSAEEIQESGIATVTPVVEIAPIAPSATGEVIGSINLTSKRVTPGTALTAYRVVPNQRKNVVAKYYVQGGSIRVDPVSGRELFNVAVEIPHTDLHSAKVQLVALRAELERSTAQPKIA